MFGFCLIETEHLGVMLGFCLIETEHLGVMLRFCLIETERQGSQDVKVGIFEDYWSNLLAKEVKPQSSFYEFYYDKNSIILVGSAIKFKIWHISFIEKVQPF